MRKTFAIILIILSICSLSAAVEPSSSNAYKHILDPVTVTSARYKAMGSAGIALTEGADSLFINPAGLASKTFDLSVPYLVFTVYNPVDIHDTGIIDSWLDDEDIDYGNVALDYLDSLGIYNKVARVDAGFALTLKGFGFGIAVQDTLHSYSSGGRSVSSSLINQLNVIATIGYGHRFLLPYHGLSIDAGLSLSLNYLAFNEAVGASGVIDALDMDDFEEYIRTGVPFLAGFSVPLTAGVTLNTPFGLSASVLLSNLNGKYYMHSYDDLDSLKDNPFKAFSSKDLDFFTDPCLSAGATWTVKIPHFQPTLALDFVDIIGFFQDGVSFRDFLGHTRLGIEMRIFRFLSIRCGISEGYFSVGTGFDFYAVELDVAYFSEEYGSEYGEKSVSGLTFRLKLGW